MRNLKRVLSLALVFAMVLGFGMSAAAVDATKLSDWDQVVHKEAVEILGMLEIVKGNTDGTFAPSKVLTRAEAMSLICSAIWKGADNRNLYADGNVGNFKDIAGHWSIGFINFGVAKNIISGNTDGTVTPDAPVSGYAILKFALCALGADSKNYEGSAWAVNVMKDAVAYGLVSGLDGFDPTEGVTRDNAAQIVYNMLGAYILNADGTVKVEVTEDFRQAPNGQYVWGKVEKSISFGKANFDYDQVKGYLVISKWGDLLSNFDPAIAGYEINQSKANGKYYFNALIETIDGFDAKNLPVRGFLPIMKSDIAVTDMGAEVSFILHNGVVKNWTVVGYPTIEYNADDIAATLASSRANNVMLVNFGRSSIEDFAITDYVTSAAGVVSFATDMEAEWAGYISYLAETYGYKANMTGSTITAAEVKLMASVADVVVAVEAEINKDLFDAAGALNAAFDADVIKNDFAWKKAGLAGNSYMFLDLDGKGSADAMNVTAYTFASVSDVKDGKIESDTAVPAYYFSNGAHKKQANVITDKALVKGDRVIYHDVAGIRFIDSVIEPLKATISRRNSNGTFVIDGVSYKTASFDGSRAFTTSDVGSENTYYLFNDRLVNSLTADTVATTYAVVYGVEAYRASALGGATTISLRVQALLEDGTNKVFDVATVGGLSPADVYALPTTGSDLTVARHIIAGVAQSSAVASSAATNFWALYEYTLNGDGKINLANGIQQNQGLNTLYTGATTINVDYSRNGNKIGSQYVTGSSVVFLQNSDFGFSIFKGIGNIPALKFASAPVTNPVGVKADLINSGDAIGYVVLPFGAAALVDTTTTAPVFAIVGDYWYTNNKVYFNLYNGTEVKAYYSENTSQFIPNAIYSTVGIDGEKVTLSATNIINADVAIAGGVTTGIKVGYISFYASNTLVAEGTAGSMTIAYNSDTAYYFLGSDETSKKLTAAQADELLEQAKPTAGYYSAVVYYNASGVATQVLIIDGEWEF